MKTLIMLAAMGLVCTNAVASPMYNSKSMSCSSIHAKMAQEGTLVLQYPSSQPGLMAYNRYVSNSMSCLGQGGMSSANVPSSDDPKCKMKTCTPITGKGPNKNH